MTKVERSSEKGTSVEPENKNEEDETNPHDTRGLEGRASTEVTTETESVAALAAPIVQPTSVTVTAVPAASALPEAVKTTEVLPGAAGTRVAPAADDFAVGVGEAAKKLDG